MEDTYKLFSDAINTCKARGMKVRSGMFGDGKTCVCAVSAVLAANGLPVIDGHIMASAERVTGLSESALWEIVFGFDAHRSVTSPYGALGERLYLEFIT